MFWLFNRSPNTLRVPGAAVVLLALTHCGVSHQCFLIPQESTCIRATPIGINLLTCVVIQSSFEIVLNSFLQLI